MNVFLDTSAVIKLYHKEVGSDKLLAFLNAHAHDLILTIEIQLQGLINYYSRAHNVVNRMRYVRYMWEVSLAKTLAAKYKAKATTIYRKYRQFFTILGQENDCDTTKNAFCVRKMS